ncbi:MAG TPA: universal stress protein, partial [Candidatus Binatia bacterium]|nr:universal stress protein [Candidatus Binatia bacterium]
MKVLIAYDGSASADTGIEGLQRAGLPTDAHALVVSIAEVWLPPPSGTDGPADTFPVPPGLKRAREHAAHILKDAQAVAERGNKLVQKHCPGWKVNYEVGNGSPAFEILNRADEWKPDLIVVGSQGRTALGRFVLGSVSQKVLTEASTSVRIARRITGSGSSGERIVLGIDGSKGSQAAIRAVG